MPKLRERFGKLCIEIINLDQTPTLICNEKISKILKSQIKS